MPPQSWLPQGGANLFQRIKAATAAAETKGIKIKKLSIGQPSGPALLSARQGAAKAVMSDAESMHEYQDNGEPGVKGFAKRFVEYHTGQLSGAPVEFMPIPGIKPMLGLIPLACGSRNHWIAVATTTDPGYPTPEVWCGYLDAGICAIHLCPENEFRFSIEDIRFATEGAERSLVMANYPHNPSGQIATRDWLAELCAYCELHGIRLFNDAAYFALSHSSKSASLAQVAVSFSGLSWAEAYSASKLIGNGTGWRVGAMVGSPDFIEDIATIKGNTDSGFVAPMAAGVLAAIENDRGSIEGCRFRYANRITMLIKALREAGMKLAVTPGAGFFTLWLAPARAFGEAVVDAEHFNNLMIDRTGVVGVPFHPYIRYAVCGPVENMIDEIGQAFEQANVSYN